MCGIIGAAAFGKLSKEEEIKRQDSIRAIVTEILQLTKERGKDATGISTLFSNGIYNCLKMGVDSDKFTTRYGGKKSDYDGYMKVWRESPNPASMFIGHCRKSSVGNTEDNANNHPIKVRDTIGIHNGTLKNHDEIIYQLGCKRDGAVDSEAIIRLIDHYSNNGKDLFTPEMIKEVGIRLDGSFSVLAFNGNNPYQLITLRDVRPMEYALIRPLNTVFIASEEKFIKRALTSYNNMARIYCHDSFIPLKSSDVSYQTLSNSSVAIFDLTREITEKTAMSDLCDKIDIPFKRIWKVGTKRADSFNNNSNFNNSPHLLPNNNTNRNNHHKSKSGDDNHKDKDLEGFIWTKSMKQYKSRDIDDADIEKDKKNNVTIVNTSLGIDCTETCREQTQKGGLVQQKDLNEEKVADVPVIYGNTKTEDNFKLKAEKSEDSKSCAFAATCEIDMYIDTKAMEIANKCANNLPILENKEDVQEALGIENVNTLEALPIQSLCNRVRKATFKAGIYKGMVEAFSINEEKAANEEKATDTESNSVVGNTEKKLKSAETKIKNLKIIIMLLCKMVDALKSSDSGNTAFNRVSNAIKIAFEKVPKTENITQQEFNNTFSLGDLRKNTTLVDIRSHLTVESK